MAARGGERHRMPGTSLCLHSTPSGCRLQTRNVVSICNQHLGTTVTALTARTTTANYPHGHFEYRPHFDLLSGTSASTRTAVDRVYLRVTLNKQKAPTGPPFSREIYRYRQENNTHSISVHLTPTAVNNIANRERHFVSIPNRSVNTK